MAKKAKETAQPQEEGLDETMTDEERAYFDAGGEPEPEQQAEPEDGAAVEPEAEPEGNGLDAEAETGAADAEEAARQRTVPHGALHEERERRKQAERQARESAEKMARLEERTNIILQRLNQPPQGQQPEPVPTAADDPHGAIEWTQRAVQHLLGERQQVQQQTEQQRQQAAEWERTYNGAVQEWQEYVQENPQANEAYDYLTESRAREYAAYGYALPQIKQLIQRDEANAIAFARQRGLSIPQMVMGSAQSRGWAPPQQEPAPQVSQQQSRPDATKAITTAQRGQQAARTLSGGGGSTEAPLSLEALLDMNEDEFAKAVAKLSPSEERRIFGG